MKIDTNIDIKAIAAFLLLMPAFAYAQSCTHTQDGRVVCPAPDAICLNDINGQVICSPPGGGIEFDLKGQAACGVGRCIRDMDGNIFCSSAARGAAAVNQNGKAVCSVSCVSGDASLCVQPVPAK